MTEDIAALPDWPPQSSATSYPEGTQKYGSTGQLWEVREGSWVRLPVPPPEEIAGLIDQLHERAEAEEDGNIAPETVAAMRRGAAALRALALENERLSKLADSYRDLAGERNVDAPQP